MAPRTRLNGPVADALRAVAVKHPDWTAGQIHRELVARYGDADSPSLRTVQRYLRAFSRPDDSGPWSMADDLEPADSRAVLAVLRYVIEGPGPDWWPTRAMAAWIARIGRAYPELEPADVHLLASLAVRGAAEDVECYLAFTPWVDPAALFAAVNRGAAPAGAIIGLHAEFADWALAARAQQEQDRATFQ